MSKPAPGGRTLRQYIHTEHLSMPFIFFRLFRVLHINAKKTVILRQYERTLR
jgi:hypothetical protein